MRQLTLNIPDKEYDFFLQLLKKFNFVKIKETDFEIPEEHKKLVIERRKNEDKTKQVKWNDVKHQYGL
jgi:hypothetical protein